MVQTPEPSREQQEYIRRLLKELQDRDRYIRELLESGSWKLTRPVRWLHRTFFARFDSRTPPAQKAAGATLPVQQENGAAPAASGAQRLWTQWAQMNLEIFLQSGARLQFPQTQKPLVSVLLVLFNRAELTLECLRSLLESDLRDFEIILIDNGSTDATGALLDRVHGARVARNAVNSGFVAAANQAARLAGGNFLLFLNNDTRVLPGTLSSALRAATATTTAGAVGGKLILADGTLQEAGSIVWRDGSTEGYGRGDDPFRPAYMFQREVDYCSGAFLLTPAPVFRGLGGFDETYRPAYYEEADYCFRLRREGLGTLYDPGAVVQHYEFASSTDASAAIELQRRNRAVFAARFAEELKSQPERPAAEPSAADFSEPFLRARMRSTRRRVLYVDDRVPHVHLGSGFPRANALVAALLGLDRFVTLYPLGTPDEAWDDVYTDFPREVEVMMGPGIQGLAAFLEARKGYYEAVIVSRPHNMLVFRAIREAHPDWFRGVRILYDAEAVFAVRDREKQPPAARPEAESRIKELLKEETGLADVADAVLCVSETDRSLFAEQGFRNLHVLRHVVVPAPSSAPFAGRSGFLFVGAIHGDNTPNADSLCWFAREILPQVARKIGGPASLTIAGLNFSDAVAQLASEQVILAGRQSDLDPFYNRARVFVAPTRYAAGVPLKIYDAAARGIPVVATSLLIEQLGWSPGVEILAGDTPETFADQCARLHGDANLWEAVRAAALQRVSRDCSAKLFVSTLEQALTGGAC